MMSLTLVAIKDGRVVRRSWISFAKLSCSWVHFALSSAIALLIIGWMSGVEIVSLIEGVTRAVPIVAVVGVVV